MTTFGRYWVGVVAAGVAGLAGLFALVRGRPASNVTYKHGPRVWEFFWFAVKDGPMLVEVDGNPFRIDAPDLAGEVASAMKSAFSEPFVAFTPSAERAAHPDYRVIWTINPAPGYNADAVCGERRPAAAPLTGDRLEMRVAFCQAGRLLAAVHGWMPAAQAGPNSAAWRRLIAQMARQLVSPEGL
jgi:hypothetical protein